MRDPYIIMVAPNGARRTKVDHPNLPTTLHEIVEAVAEAQQAGAHAAHVHVRDDHGNHVLDADRYLRLTDALRNRCGDELIVQITTESVGQYTAAEQCALVKAVKPEAVSIAYRELFAAETDVGPNADFLLWALEERIAIQWIVYDTHDLQVLADLAEQGIVPDVSNVLYVLGRYTKGQASFPTDMLPFLSTAEGHQAFSDTQWSVCAFGQAETACLTTALTLGGDVRVGFENSLWNADATVAHSNAERVSIIAECAQRVGLKPCTQAEARARLLAR